MFIERFGSDIQCFFATDVYLDIEKDEAEFGDVSRQLEASPIAQLVRAPH